jgi:hypothetical protein
MSIRIEFERPTEIGEIELLHPKTLAIAQQWFLHSLPIKNLAIVSQLNRLSEAIPDQDRNPDAWEKVWGIFTTTEANSLPFNPSIIAATADYCEYHNLVRQETLDLARNYNPTPDGRFNFAHRDYRYEQAFVCIFVSFSHIYKKSFVG